MRGIRYLCGVTLLKTADVFVNIPVKSIAQAYTYRVPEALAHLASGWRVLVPFGGRKAEGFVLEVHENAAPPDFALKDILSAVDDEAWFTPELIEAAKWLAAFYLCPLAEMMRLFMPGKSGLSIHVLYAAKEGSQEPADGNCAIIWRTLLERGPLAGSEIKKSVPMQEEKAEQSLAALLRAGLIRKEYAATKRNRAKMERVVRLAEGIIVDEELLGRLSRRKAQKKLLELLREKPEQDMAEIRKQGVSAMTVRAAVQAGLAELRERRVLRDSYRDRAFSPSPTEQAPLTEDQKRAFDAIALSIAKREYHGFLLHGVTGSGKTRVYMEAVREVRRQGRRAIVLVPEIALTGQLVASFQTYFSGDLIVMHSGLSLAERNDAVWRARRGEAGIIIGARSALFVPVGDVGLIVLDEEQDMSYKQDEAPRYHARVVAGRLAMLYGAVLLLGSATPSLESYYHAKRGDITLLAMPKRVGDVPLPETECVDMRQELQMGNRRILSRRLAQLVQETLAKKEQIIIMLNRRGYSTFILCRTCGEVIKCRHCGLPMVYHRDGRLLCHYCDEAAPVPSVCPKCGSKYIKYFGSGTEKLEQELQELVPEARLARMDRDTMRRKFSHEVMLDAFKRGAFDILLGTQMVAKGHDVPGVTTVGIISADASLNMPDFRAAERCFILITQTAGRAGRREKRGHTVVQSYNPEHYAVTSALAQDYEAFYAAEIRARRELFYPPFSRIVKLVFHGKEEQKAKDEALKFRAAFLAAYGKDTKNRIAGPAPAMVACYRGTYRFCVHIRTAKLSRLLAFLRGQGMHRRDDVAVDIDPLHTM